MSSLQMGMSKNQVRGIFGAPDRVLFAGVADGGYEEVLQYRTYNNELYALTFFNDRLESYGFITEDVPPVSGVRPPIAHPIYPPRPPITSPNRPGSGNQTRPPVTNERPSTGTGRPGSSSGTSQPETSRPGNSGSTTRPETSRPENSNTTRPSTRPTTRSDSDSQGTEREGTTGRTSR